MKTMPKKMLRHRKNKTRSFSLWKSHTYNRSARCTSSRTALMRQLGKTVFYVRLCNMQEALAQMHNRVSNFGLPKNDETAKVISDTMHFISVDRARLVGSMSWKYFAADSCAKKRSRKVGEAKGENFQEFLLPMTSSRASLSESR